MLHVCVYAVVMATCMYVCMQLSWLHVHVHVRVCVCMQLSRRRVKLTVPSTKEEVEVLLRQPQVQRSQTMNYGPMSSVGAKDLRSVT